MIMNAAPARTRDMMAIMPLEIEAITLLDWTLPPHSCSLAKIGLSNIFSSLDIGLLPSVRTCG